MDRESCDVFGEGTAEEYHCKVNLDKRRKKIAGLMLKSKLRGWADRVGGGALRAVRVGGDHRDVHRDGAGDPEAHRGGAGGHPEQARRFKVS